MLKYIFLTLLPIMISGCAAVGVVSSSDPEVKISQAYSLLDNGRAFPAERLFKEVIAIAKERNDIILEARGITGLGDIYNTANYGAYKENLTNYKLAMSKYEEGASKFIQGGYYKRAAMAYLGAAWAAHSGKNKSKTCTYYNKSLEAYKKPGAHKKDAMNPSMDSKKKPFLKYLSEYKTKDGCKK